jgi:hypothetical protein
VPITVTGRIVDNTRRLFTGEGEILLPNGEVAVLATAKYMKLKLSEISDFEANGESWQCYPYEDDPAEIELPEA